MKKTLTNKELFDFLISEVNQNFEGWDFLYLESTGRMKEFPLSWNYRKKIMMRISNVSSLLDMGTGGGEFLSTPESVIPEPQKNSKIGANFLYNRHKQ